MPYLAGLAGRTSLKIRSMRVFHTEQQAKDYIKSTWMQKHPQWNGPISQYYFRIYELYPDDPPLQIKGNIE